MNDEELEFFQEQGLVCQDVIASGSYGIIYNVYHRAYNTNFALKKIPQKFFHEGEIECLMNIDDPRIVRLYKYYKFNEYVYLLMEYCPSDLEKYMRTHSITSQEEMKRIIHDVIAAIKVCHDRNIAHCDIKPSNFLIDNYGRIKIGDFGLSMIDSQSCCCRGTPLFMAPEVYLKNGYDPILADVWSVGVLTFLIATGEYPFYGKDRNTLAQSIRGGFYNDREVKDHYLKNLIRHCLDKNPQNRPKISELLGFQYFQNSLKVPEFSKQDQFLSTCRLVRPKIEKRRSSFGDQFVRIPKIKIHRNSNDSILV